MPLKQHPTQPLQRSHQRTFRAATMAVVFALLCSLLVVWAPSPAQAVTAFASKFQVNVEGDIVFAANANTTCLVGCTTANSAAISYVDVDGTAASPIQSGGSVATFNSSTSDLAVPSGSTVLYAGLFWGGNTASGERQSAGGGGADAPTVADRNKVYFKTPAMTGYTLITSTDVDNDTTASSTFPVFHAYANVTSLVQAVSGGGVGTYSAADIQSGTGSSGLGDWAGWSLVVAYSNPNSHLRNLNVFNGFNKVSGTTDVDVAFGPFVTPAVGPVKVKVGIVVQDGDPGITGDAATLAAGSAAACSDTNPLLSDSANASTNLFNSSITNLAASVTRNPSTTPTWGYDAKIINADNVNLPNGSTNACLRLKTNGDTYFPDAVTTAIELPSPKLVATKTGIDLNGGNLNPGDTIEYTIDMTNTGDDIATNTVLTDPLPAGLTYVPGTLSVATGPNAGAKGDAVGDGDQANFAGTTATFYLGTGATSSTGGMLSPASATSVKLRATVNASTPGGTTLVNSATINYRGATIPAQVLNPVASAATTPVAKQVDLAVTKTDALTVVAAGASNSYTITVKNNGPQAVTGASVADTIPALLVGPNWSCSVSGQSAAAACGTVAGSGNIVSTVDLGVNDVATFVVSGTVDPAAPSGTGTLANTATATPPAGTTDVNATNDSATDTDNIVRQADISVTKTDGITNAIPGTAVTYAVVVANAGPSNAGFVTVADTVPAALTGVTWTCSATFGSSCVVSSGSGNSIATSASLLKAGSATYLVTGTLNPATPAGTNSLVNTVTATLPTGVTEINNANNSATDTDNVTPQANLSITKTDGTTDAIPGTTVTYTVTVGNAGPSTATAATIADTVPAALTGVTWSCAAAGAGASCGAATGTGNAISTTATLPTATTVTYTITGTLNPTTPSGTNTLANTATVTPPTGTTDLVPGNNSATDTDNVKATADLVITKTDGLTNAVPGSPITYTIVMSNLGPSTATNATITDSIPATLASVTWTCTPTGAGASCGAATGTGNALNTTATLPANTSVTYLVSATVVATTAAGSGTLVNTAVAMLPSGVTDPTPGPTQATDTDNVTPTADLSVTKTDGVTAAVPGSPIVYTVVVRNAGPSTATAATVADTIPAAITGVTWTCAPTGSGASCGAASGSGNAISSTVTLPAGTSATYTITGTLAPGTAGGTATLVNTATVTVPSGLTDPTLGNNTATDTDDVTPRADLAIVKTANVANILPGGALTYTVVVTNNGPSNVTAATITDTIPATLIGVSWTCSSGGAGATCGAASGAGNAISTTANLAVGTSVTYTVSGTVVTSTPSGTIANTANVAPPAGVTDPSPLNNSSTVNVTVDPATDLSITKSDGVTTATPGGTVTYTIVASNGGPNAVTGATVTDNLPAAITSASWTCSATTGSSCGVVGGSGNIASTVNLAVGGSATYSVTATLSPGATGSVVNSASVAVPSGVVESNAANNSASDTDTLSPTGDLSINKTDGSLIATPGSPITYTITVSNAGPSTAVNATVADTIPVAVASPTWTCAASAGSACGAASGSGNISTAVTVKPGGNAVFTVTGTVDSTATGSLTNTATVTPPTGYPDTTPANNTSTDTDTLVPSGDLSVTKTDGITDAVPGATVTYTIVASNAGPSKVVAAQVSDALPAALFGATWTCLASTGSACGAASGTGNLADTPTIAVGGTATYTLTATVNESTPAGTGTLTNTATIAAPTGFTETNAANNSSTDSDNVTPRVDLAITKTDGSTTAIPGSSVIYTVTVTNSGPSTATNAAVTDTLPASLTGANWTCAATGTGASCGSPSGTGNVATSLTLPKGTSATYTITTTLNPATPAGTAALVNVATVARASGTTDTNAANNSATDVDDVTPRGDLTITKTDGITNAVPGTNVTYTVVVGNAGPSTATAATVTDNLPSLLTGVTWTCAATGIGASCGIGSGAGNLATTATMPTGTTVTYTITATLDPLATAGSNTLTNSAVVGAPAGFTDTNPGNNSATDTDSVTPRADLSVSKTDGITNAIPGTAVTYSITVSNAGPSFANASAVTDSVPAALSGVTWTCSAASGSSCGAPSGGGNSISTSANVAVGSTVTYVVGGTLSAATPAGTATLVNTANVAAAAGTVDPVLTNNAATDTDNVTPAADLVVNKTRSGAVVAGLPITYTVTVTNLGPSNVVGATVTDNVPAQILSPTWTCAASTGSSCATASGTGSVAQAANIASAGTVTFTITGAIDPFYVSGSIANTASAVTPSGVTDPTPGNNSSTVTDTVGAITDLRAVKTRSGPLVAGSTTTYTVVITNDGPSTANSAIFTDPLPTGIASWTWTCSAPGVGASCASASGSGSISTTYTLPPGQSATYTITALLSSTAGGQIKQIGTATAVPSTDDPNPDNNVGTETGIVAGNVDLRVTKTDSKTSVVAGTANIYTVVVMNSGPSDAIGATVVDNAPSNFTGVTWTCSATGSSSCPPSGSGSIAATVNVLVGGTVTFTVTGTVSPSSTLGAGALTNTATATAAAGVTELAPGDNSATDTDSVTGVADLAVTKTDGSTSAVPGGPITYTISVTNNGPSNVIGATVVDAVPPTIFNPTWTCAASSGASCAASGSGSINQTVDLGVGASLTYTLTGTVDPAATVSLSNTASAAVPGTMTDPTSGNNSATDADTLGPAADLAIVKSNGASSLTPGETVTYTIVATNGGPSSAIGATVTDTIPAGLLGATWTCSASAGASCAASGSGSINQIVNLGVGSSVTFIVNGTIAATLTGSLANTASISTPSGVSDPNAANNSSTDTDPLSPSVDLAVTKTDGQVAAVPGTPLTYTMLVTNNGPSSVTGATVGDSLPSALTSATWTCIASSGSSCAPSGSGSINDSISLLVGGTATYALTATVAAGASGSLTNTVTATVPSGTNDPTPGNNSSSDTDTLDRQANLAISKSDGVTTRTPGATVSYTIVASNAGPSNVVGAMVSDALPSALTSASWTCSGFGGGACAASGSGSISDTVNLPVGATVTYTLNATIASNASGSITNTATIATPSGVTDSALANNSSTDTDTLTPLADLSITKTDGVATAVPGTPTTYTIVVRNVGPSDAVGAAVADALPAALIGATWTCASAGGATCTASGTGSITDTVNLPVGSTLTYSVSATINQLATGTLTNSATVSPPSGTTDPTPANNSATDTTTLAPTHDLQITKTDGSLTEIPGTPVSYTIVVTNAGPSAAAGATVADSLPVALSGATWTCAASTGGSCTASGTGSISDTVSLQVGSTATYTLTANVSPGATGSLSNTATVAASATSTDPDTTNNSATDIDALSRTADLTVSKTDGSSTAIPGQTVSYTIVATNVGPSAVTGATVTDSLPSALSAATWTCSASSGATCTASGTGSITDTVNLPSGATATYTLTALLASTASGTLSNTASVTAPTGVTDPTPANNTATDTDTLARVADLSVTKTDGSPTAVPGQTVTYTIVATNAGPSSVVGAVTSDLLSSSLTGATWTCSATSGSSCAASGSGSINDSASLLVGGTATYTITATVSQVATGSLSNTASIAPPSDTTDPTLGNNSGTDTDTLTPISDLSITKTDGTLNATAGTSLTYSIVVANAGPSTAPGAHVVDTLPSALTGSVWSCTGTGGATCTSSGSGDIDQLVVLPSGTSVTFLVTATLSPSATGSVTNTATIAVPAGSTDPTSANNSATDTDVVVRTADLAITKTDSKANAVPGTSDSYTIVVTNLGPSFAVGATVTDSVPAALTGVAWTCAASSGASCGNSGTGSISDTVTLPVGATATYTVSGTISATATGTLTNTATVAAPSGTTDPTPGNNSAADTDSLTPTADLAITKTDGVPSGVPGGSVVYTIVARNAGPSSSPGSHVVDSLPATLLSATWTCASAGGATCTASGSGSINQFVNLPVGGSVTYTVSATIDSAASGSLTNTATVATPSGVTDPVPADNSATDSDALGPRAELSITKTDGRTTVVPGTSDTYTISVHNAGPSDVIGAAVTDSFPAAFVGATWSCSGTGLSTCSASGSGPISDTVSLPNGTTITYIVSGTIGASATGTISNTATVAPPSGVLDTNPSDDTSTDTDTLLPAAALSITKTDAASTAIPGTPVTYTMVARNDGPSNVVSAPITDSLPAALTGATWTCTASPGATCAASGTGSIADAADLIVGATVTYTLTATINPAATGTLTNTASIDAPTGVIDGTPSDNTASDADTLLGQADVSITKTDLVANAVAGSSVTYTIVVSNAGPSAVAGATVTDSLPAAIASATWTCAASSGASCSPSGSGGIFDAVNLGVGATATYTLTAAVASSATGSLANTATIAAPSGTTDPTSANNSATDTDTLSRAADLSITKTDFFATEIPGTTVTYTIVATNNGPSDVTGATVADLLPASLSSATWTCAASTGGSCTATGTGNIADTVNLTAGATTTYTLTATIAPGATGSLANTATIAPPSGTTDPTSANNSATDTDTLVRSADLSVTKTDLSATAMPGQAVSYTIVVTNNGPSNVAGATVNDSLAASLSGATWTCSASSGGTCSASGSGNISDSVNLTVGATATYALTATINPAATGTLANTASVALPTGTTDPTPGNNSATDTDTLAPSADLSITKTDSSATEVPGTTVTYAIVVSNAGPSNVTGATVTDSLPGALSGATWTCAASSGGTCASTGTGNISDSVDLAVGATVTYALTATISAAATGTLVNTASIATPTGTTDPTPGNNSATDSDTLNRSVDLQITKTDLVTAAVPGGSVTYTIVAKNLGPSVVTGATVADTIPASLTLASWTCVASSGATCAASGTGSINDTVNLVVGATATYTLTATVVPTATGGLTNTATVATPTGTADPIAANNSATDIDALGPEADLTITKTDSSLTAVPGKPISYTIVVTNNGPSSVIGATVADTMPALLVGTSWICAASAGAACAASGTGDINDTVNLPVGSTATYTISATLDAAATGMLANTASVTAPASVTDPTPANNTATDSDTIAPRADLAITKTDSSATAVPGGTVTYTIVATNNGPSVVTGAAVTDTLASQLNAATWACVATLGATCTSTGTGDVNDTVDLVVGASATYTVTATIDAAATGSLANTAAIDAPVGTTDPTPSNDRATDTDSLTPRADLAITKTDSSNTAVAGSPVVYTIVARNLGPSNVVGATVTDTLPASLSAATWTCVASAGACSPSGTGNVSDTVDLAVGDTATYTLTATSGSATTGSVSNTATVATPTGTTDPVPANNTATDTDTVTRTADLSVTKSDASTTAVPGGTVTYTVIATNAGPSDVTGASVADPLPASLSASTWTCVASPGATCTTSGTGDVNDTVNLVVGATATYTLTATVAANATGTLSNAASVAAPVGTTDPTSTNNADTDVDTLTRVADLAITKTDSVTAAVPGGSVNYTIVATNNGPSGVNGASISDVLPAALTGATWTCSASPGATCGAPSGTGNIGDTVDLFVGAAVTYTLHATVLASATGGLTNTATITPPSGTTDPTSANNSAKDIDALGPEADLAITKTDASLTVVPGGTITYTIVATNQGPSAAVGAVVSDILPAALTGATWTCVASSGATCSASGTGDINDAINLAVGATATYTLTANVSASVVGTLSNTTSVVAPATVTDTSPGNDNATDVDTVAGQADLAITKTDGVAAGVPGTATTYTIVATNNGPSDVTGATLTDSLPSALTAAAWTCTAGVGASCTASGAGSISDTVDLDVGATVTYTLTATFAAAASGTVSNTASVAVSAGTTDPTPANNTATDSDTMTPRSDLAITKTDASLTATAGSPVTYTIVATNNGPSTSSATISDTLPSDLTGATWTCVASTGASCGASSGTGNLSDVANLPVGATATYTLTATLIGSATGTLDNTATIAAPSGTLDVTPANNSATDSDTITVSADLHITKTDAVANAIPGMTVTYTIVATNSGPSDVIGATVTDALPSTLTSATWACAASTGATCASSGTGDINDTVDLVSGASVTYTVVATLDPIATGTLDNTATVSAPTGVSDPTPANNSATDSDAVKPTADLQVTKTDGALDAVPGGSVTYTIKVKNNGPSAVVGATVTDTLPAPISGATWTCAASAGATCGSASGPGDIAETVDLAPNATVTYILIATIFAGSTGSLVNTATAAVPTGVTDPTPANDSATDIDALGPRAELAMVKTDSAATATPGNTVTYTITATNAGPSSAVGATVVDTLPASFTGATWTCIGAIGGICSASGSGDINDTVNLPVGGKVTYTLTASLDSAATGTLANTATVTTPTGVTDTNPTDSTSTDTDTLVGTSDLSISKTDGSPSAVPGSTVRYTIVASNAGPSDVVGASVIDNLPSALSSATWTCFAPLGSACSASGTGGVSDTVSIPAGGHVTYTLTATVAASAVGSLANTATVTVPSGVTDPTPGNNNATDSDILTPRADLSITKHSLAASQVPGTTVTYSIVAANAGPSDATGVTVTDTLPSALSNATWTCLASTGATCAPSGTGDINDVINLPVGTDAVYILTAMISPTATGALSNTATVTTASGTTDPALSDNSATEVDGLSPAADLSISKTDGVATVNAGSTVTYTIAVTNNGPSAVTGATVNDSLPAALTGATWTCSATAGGLCTTSATGSILDSVDLRVGSTATYVVAATVDPAATGNLTNSVSVAVPAGVTDPVATNDSAVDVDVVNPPPTTTTTTTTPITTTTTTTPAPTTTTTPATVPVVTVPEAPTSTTATTEPTTTVPPTTVPPTTTTPPSTTVTPAAPKTRNVDGVVFRDVDNNGLRDSNEVIVPGAHITIHLPDGTVLSATSDATGHYSFKDVPFGDYPVEVTGIGEGRVTKTIAVRGQNADLDLPVRVISPDLALTGAPSTQEAEWALLLVGLGLLMVLATRRRKKPGM